MTTRRSFIQRLAVAAASFAILPSAATYARQWRPVRNVWVPNPAWVSAPYELVCVDFANGHDYSVHVWHGPPPEVRSEMPYIYFRRFSPLPDGNIREVYPIVSV